MSKIYREDGTEIVPLDSPDAEYKFFLIDPSDPGYYYFKSVEDRNRYAHELIRDLYLENDGWGEDEIDEMLAGEVTHLPAKTDIIKRPPADQIDENGRDYDENDWSGGHTEICDYKLIPLPGMPNTNVKNIVKQWLVSYGYDGLTNGGSCACLVENFFPCHGDGALYCVPGWRIKKCTGECGNDFCIIAQKDEVCQKVD